MKRWLAPTLGVVTLLANIAERGFHASFLETWSPGAVYPVPAFVGVLVFISVPFSLASFWWMWRPSRERVTLMSRSRKIVGNSLLLLSMLLWLAFLYKALFYAWLTAVPGNDLIFCKRQHAMMANCAAVALGFGGLISLWLKGIRIPPRE